MDQKQITVALTFTRDQLTSKANPEGNEVLAAQIIFSALRRHGVPVIGILGILGVEWGTLACTYVDGLDGDEWLWTWVGVPMPEYFVQRCLNPGHRIKLNDPLPAQIAARAALEDDEL